MRKEVLRPEYLLQDKTKDILVYTVDKKIVKFKGGDYDIIGTDQSERIRGRGLQYNVRTTEYDIPVEGTIVFNDIEAIVFQQKTFLGSLGELLFIGVFVLMVIFYLFFRNANFNVG